MYCRIEPRSPTLLLLLLRLISKFRKKQINITKVNNGVIHFYYGVPLYSSKERTVNRDRRVGDPWTIKCICRQTV